jgi:hypothetical protein
MATLNRRIAEVAEKRVILCRSFSPGRAKMTCKKESAMLPQADQFV